MSFWQRICGPAASARCPRSPRSSFNTAAEKRFLTMNIRTRTVPSGAVCPYRQAGRIPRHASYPTSIAAAWSSAFPAGRWLIERRLAHRESVRVDLEFGDRPPGKGQLSTSSLVVFKARSFSFAQSGRVMLGTWMSDYQQARSVRGSTMAPPAALGKSAIRLTEINGRGRK